MNKHASLVRRATLVVAGGIVAYLALSCIAGVILIEGALHVARRTVSAQEEFTPLIARWSGRGFEDSITRGADGAELRAWIARPDRWNGNTVILLHGVGDNREGMVSFAPMFLRNEYAVLVPDSRAHGESGGALVTYGWLESGDIRQWVSVLQKMDATLGSQSKCIYLMGESMGAAIAVQAAAISGICGVVAEAPFSSFREIGYERIAQFLGISLHFSRFAAWPTVNASFLYARLRYGIDFNRVSPELILKSPHAPVLLIAGLDDQNIPPRHSQRIIASGGDANALWLVPGAGHTDASRVAPVEFEQRVLSWFGGHVKSPKIAPASRRATSIW